MTGERGDNSTHALGGGMTGTVVGVIAGVTALLLLAVGLAVAGGLTYLCRTRGDYYTQV